MTKNKPPQDLTGLSFGELTVISFSHNRDRPVGPMSYWYCHCSCGATKTTSRHCLLYGHTKSCGHIHREGLARSNITQPRQKNYKYSAEEAAYRALYNTYKHQAKIRKHNFELTFEQALVLFTSNCYYTNRLPPVRNIYTGRKTKADTLIQVPANGIDRFKNNQGYTLENSVTCFAQVNIAKHTSDSEDFIQMCNEVARTHPRPL